MLSLYLTPHPSVCALPLPLSLSIYIYNRVCECSTYRFFSFILISFFAISPFESCFILQQQITRRATADDGMYTRCVLCIVHTQQWVHTDCTLQIVIHIRAKIHNVKRKNFWIISCLHRRFYYFQYFSRFHVCVCESVWWGREAESIPLLLMFLLLLLAVFFLSCSLRNFALLFCPEYART